MNPTALTKLWDVRLCIASLRGGPLNFSHLGVFPPIIHAVTPRRHHPPSLPSDYGSALEAFPPRAPCVPRWRVMGTTSDAISEAVDHTASKYWQRSVCSSRLFLQGKDWNGISISKGSKIQEVLKMNSPCYLLLLFTKHTAFPGDLVP